MPPIDTYFATEPRHWCRRFISFAFHFAFSHFSADSWCCFSRRFSLIIFIFSSDAWLISRHFLRGFQLSPLSLILSAAFITAELLAGFRQDEITPPLFLSLSLSDFHCASHCYSFAITLMPILPPHATLIIAAIAERHYAADIFLRLRHTLATLSPFSLSFSTPSLSLITAAISSFFVIAYIDMAFAAFIIFAAIFRRHLLFDDIRAGAYGCR